MDHKRSTGPQEVPQPALVDDLDPELLCLGHLGTGVVADDEIAGLLGHAVSRRPTLVRDLRLELAAWLREGAGYDKRLAGQWALPGRWRWLRIHPGRQQLADQVPGGRVLEEVMDRLRHHLADAVDAVEGGNISGLDRLDGAEAARQHLGRRPPHRADAERDQEPGQDRVLAPLDAVEELAGGHLGEAVELGQVFRRQLVDVAGDLDHATVEQLPHGLIPEQVDVQGGRKVGHRLQDPRRAFGIDAVPHRLARLAYQRRAADGTVSRRLPTTGARPPPGHA